MSTGKIYMQPAVFDGLRVPAGPRYVPLPFGPECIEDDCPRPPYDEDGRCKRHHDLDLYRRDTEARRGRAGG